MAAAAKTTAMAWSSLLLLSTLATVHVDGATGGGGNAGAPAPSVDCTDALLSLAGCLSYVQEGSTVAKPDESCCSGLKDVVRTEVACLCQAFQGSQNFGVTLNMTKALQLPSACKVKTPPFSKCHLSIPGVTDGAPDSEAIDIDLYATEGQQLAYQQGEEDIEPVELVSVNLGDTDE